MCNSTEGKGSCLRLRDRRLSIVIPNARSFPNKLVEALQSQARKGDEVLVIRNGCRLARHYWVGIGPESEPAPANPVQADRSIALSVVEAASVRIIQLEEDYGAAAARNRGWQEASNDSVVFLDDDVAIDETFLDLVRRYLDREPKAGVATFRMRSLNARRWASVVDATISLDRGDGIRRSDGVPVRLQHIWMYGAGGALLASRNLLGVTGGFKRHFGAGRRNGGTEDMEFLWHASRHTDIEYCGSISVRHDDVSTPAGLCRKLREYGRGIGHLGGAATSGERFRYVYGYCLHILTGVRLGRVPDLRLRTFCRLKASALKAVFETALVYLLSLIASRDADVLCPHCRGRS